MNVSSSSLNAASLQLYGAKDNKKAESTFDTALETETNYPTKKIKSLATDNATQDNASTSASFEQFVYAPNISALFNAYLDKQKLGQNMDGKKKEIADRLTSAGMDKDIAKNYAENGVEFYKQMMEVQLKSKINGEVQRQDNLKQMVGESGKPNPYLQMTGTLINMYS
jgi:hypothetical protein